MEKELKNQLVKYLDFVGCTEKANKEIREQFIEIATAYGLNPFKREIHLVPFGEKHTIIVGYEVYIKRANQTERNGGWKAWTEGEIKAVQKTVRRKKRDGTFYDKDITVWEGDLKAFCEIQVKGWVNPFVWSIEFSEFCAENENWEKRPKFMIKKVCIAQAFRLCFTDEMAGLPYTEEEMQVINSEKAKDDELLQLRNKAFEACENSTITDNSKAYTKNKIKNATSEDELNAIIEGLKPFTQGTKQEPVTEPKLFEDENA